MIARWFWREWRSPSLLIVWLALSLAVACVLALGSISDRMEKGLSQQSREFMAGDRTLRSSREVPAEWIAQAGQSGLSVSEQLSFATMTFAGDTPQLADVKAVDDRYPLYGTLETQPPGLKPQAGSVLLAPRLMALLNLKTGDTIDVGDATLRIAGEVIQEPDAGFNPFQMAPRLMMNMADVAKTGAVQPGSRVAWRYKFAGDAEQLANYEQWLLPKLGPEHRWIGLDQDDSALGKSLERSQQFLLLSALLTLLLAVAAVAVAMGHYCRSRYDLVAILKTLGAGRAQLRKLIVGQWLLLLTLSLITGRAAGLALERLLLLVLKPVLPAALPPASGWPWLWAVGATGVISLLVGLRPYRLLLATLPLRVLRQDVVANVWPLKIWIPTVSAVVVGLLAWLMGGSPLLWSVLAGAVVLALLCGLVGWGLLWLLKRLTLSALPLRLAVNRLLRQPLLNRYLARLRRPAAGHQWIMIRTLFAPGEIKLAIQRFVFVPVRGVAVDLRQTGPDDRIEFRRPRLMFGEEGLHRHYLLRGDIDQEVVWALRGQLLLPAVEQIAAQHQQERQQHKRQGKRRQLAEGRPRLAQRLGVKIGDTVTFTGDTQDFSAKVSSVRKVDWESLRPNFFFIFPSGALDGQPQSWLTSFRWDNGPGMLTQLNREFPTVSLLDIGAILRQVGQVLSQVSRALEVMVGLVTACGVLLLLAQVQVGMRQRHQELVVWRTLGAGKSLLRATLWAEFALLGLVSGLVAAIGAEVALAMLQTKVFDFPWTPDWRLWGMLPLTGAVLLSLCGGGLGLRLLKGKALFRQFSQ